MPVIFDSNNHNSIQQVRTIYNRPSNGPGSKM